jgi:hypothetical protein
VSAVSVEVPEGCRLASVDLKAETDAAFETAVKQFGLSEYGEISNTTEKDGVHTGHRYRFAGGVYDGLSMHVRGPKHEMKLVPA